MAPNDWNSVRDDVMKTLGRIDANLEALVGLQKDMKQDHNDLADRVAKLEGWKHWVLGIAAAVSFFFTYLAQYVKLK